MSTTSFWVTSPTVTLQLTSTTTTSNPIDDNFVEITSPSLVSSWCSNYWWIDSEAASGSITTSFDPQTIYSGPFTIYSTVTNDWWCAHCLPKAKSEYRGVCPPDMSVARATQWNILSGADVTGTAWEGLCCQSGYTWYTSTSDQSEQSWCWTRFSPTDVVTALLASVLTPTTCASTTGHPYDGLDCPGRAVLTATLTNGVEGFVTPIKVWWDRDDLNNFPSSYSSSLSKACNLPGDPQATEVIYVDRDTGPSSLNRGAIAGIVVGAVLGTAIIILSVVVVLWRHKRQQHRKALQDLDGTATLGKSTSGDTAGDANTGLWVSELPTEHTAGELGAQASVHKSSSQNVSRPLVELAHQDIYGEEARPPANSSRE